MKTESLLKDLQREFFEKISGMYSRGEAKSITDIVFQEVFGYSKSDLIIHSNQKCKENDKSKLQDITGRLLLNEPVQYILEKAHFYGLDLIVNRNVLIPRPETEELVDWIIQDINKWGMPVRMLDIGTGSGCIALALKQNLPEVEVFAIDISKEAISIGVKNMKRYHLDVEFKIVDILKEENWSILPLFDVIVCNPPYVLTHEKKSLDSNVTAYEPELALFVKNNDPLQFYNAVSDFVLRTQSPDSTIYFEINENKGPEVIKLLKKKGFSDIILKKDLSGKNRMIRIKNET